MSDEKALAERARALIRQSEGRRIHGTAMTDIATAALYARAYLDLLRDYERGRRALPDDPPDGYTFGEAVRAVCRERDEARAEARHWKTLLASHPGRGLDTDQRWQDAGCPSMTTALDIIDRLRNQERANAEFGAELQEQLATARAEVEKRDAIIGVAGPLLTDAMASLEGFLDHIGDCWEWVSREGDLNYGCNEMRRLQRRLKTARAALGGMEGKHPDYAA
jgi:hypothetical protein